MVPPTPAVPPADQEWKGPKLMGVKAYARHRGVTPPAVRKAIKDGRIKQRKDGKIHAPTADADWDRNTGPTSTAKPPEAQEPAVAPAAAEAKAELGSARGGQDDGPPLDLDDLDRNLNLTEARAAKEAYLARLRKLEYEEKAGRLIDREQVRRTQFAILRTVRDRTLEVPDRLSDELAAEDDPGMVHELLRSELRAVLTELARYLRELEIPAETDAA